MELFGKLSLKKLPEPEYRYILLLLYWPLMGLMFWTLEAMSWRVYQPIEASLDALNPFCSLFVLPYFFWFVYIIGSLVYFFFCDKTAFVKYMWFVIITHSIALIVYAVYPTSQELRPEIVGEGFFDSIIRWLYGYDTNTNVCPSLHVIGSFAVCFAAFSSEKLKRPLVRIFYAAANILICASTVLIKQHSIIDVFWGVVVAVLVYPFVFCNNRVSRLLFSRFALCMR